MIVISFIIIILLQLSAANSVLKKIPGEECIFTIGGHIYDLSELAKEEYWQYSEVYHADLGSRKRYFISICHSLKNFKGCENSNVCFTSTDKTKNSSSIYRSGGRALLENSAPKYVGEGNLNFSFSNGSACENGRSFANYSTQLYLQCPLENEELSYGPVLMSSSTCTIIFAWITKAACPRKHKTAKKSCIINFSDNSSINLNSLHSKTFYPLMDNKFSFEINVCGPIINGSCRGNNVCICDTSKPNNPVPIAFTDHEMIEWNSEQGNMDMLFKENNVSSNIHIECDRKMVTPKMNFKNVSVINGAPYYQFEIKTALACLSIESNCILRNWNGSIIDLRPLRKNNTNWEVYLPMNKDMGAQLYLLNICGPLSKAETTGCSGGLVGACKPSINNEAALNLGYVTSGPVIANDGSISVLYTGGDACNKDAPSSSTKIILHCSDTEHLPVLTTVTDSCLHVFEWYTPAACPMEQIVGENCIVKDPLHGEIFDLNPLRNLSRDYFVKSQPNNFLINVCGPLISDCGSEKTSVCALGNNTRQSAGSSGKLVFDDGTLVMEFKGGAKCGNGSWSTKILILCSHVAMETIPEHFQTNEESCTHVFIWHTFHACPSFTSVDCFIQDRNSVYDLTALSEPMDNWEFETTQNHTTRKYVFNICRSVVHSKEYRCPYKAGACLMDSKPGSNVVSLGNVVTSPYIQNDTVMIRYTGGDLCTNVKRYETLIIFECVPWTYNSVPLLIKDDNCQTIIKVPTNHACPRRLLPHIETATGNCSVTNPFTNYIYDVSQLRSKKPAEISDGNNGTIFINVCGQLQTQKCSSTGSGSCWLEKKNDDTKIINMGLANSNLQFSKWSTFLLYKDGDSCYSPLHGTVPRSTKINFVCSENNDVSGPVFIDYDENSCVLYVNWHTKLACERQINCFAKTHDGRVFDLSPFVRYFGNYVITNPYKTNTTYYLNVCKPLNPIPGIRCHPGSSACMVVKADGSSEVSSLGHALVDPVVISENKVSMMYSHGSSCPLEGLSSSTLSSRITFVCNRTVGVGEPVFVVHTHDCQAQFEWHTSLVCPDEIEDESHFGNHCRIYLDKAKANTDLMPLYKPDGYEVKHGNKTFKVNVCGPVCGKSGVCTADGTSYGLFANAKLLWESDMLKLSYYTGDYCSSSLTFTRYSIIYFECDMKAGYGAPVAEPWNKEESCVMVFNWRTNVTCIEAIYKPELTSLRPVPSPEVNVSTIPSTTVDVVTTPPTGTNANVTPSAAVIPKSDDLNSGGIGVSIMIAVIVISLVVVSSLVLFLRSLQGRRLTTQAKGFFRRKGDEVFIMDDQHLQAI